MKSNHTKFLRLKTYLIFNLLSLIFIQASAVKRIDANPICVAYMLAQDTDSASIANTLSYYGYAPQNTNTERSSDTASADTPYSTYRHPNGYAPQNTNTERSSDTASADTPYSTYRHPNGTTIRYSFKDEAYPYVEVKSKSGNPDAILTNLGFQKAGTIYQQKVNKFTRSKFNCAPGAGSTLIFHKTLTPQSSSK